MGAGKVVPCVLKSGPVSAIAPWQPWGGEACFVQSAFVQPR